MNAWKKILKEWILPLGAEVLVIVFLLKVVFMLVLVPSGSMLPTIQKNSILFCTKPGRAGADSGLRIR